MALCEGKPVQLEPDRISVAVASLVCEPPLRNLGSLDGQVEEVPHMDRVSVGAEVVLAHSQVSLDAQSSQAGFLEGLAQHSLFG
jgi:hypothetical protein